MAIKSDSKLGRMLCSNNNPKGMTTILLIFLALSTGASGQTAALCRLSGQSQQSNTIIMDIEESREGQIDQTTNPEDLPITGDPLTEIELKLSFPSSHQHSSGAAAGSSLSLMPPFVVNGKRLQLARPLDRDDGDVTSVVFQVTCTDRATGDKKTYPVVVRVSDVNDNAPAFVDTPYYTAVPELTPIGSTVFRNIKALDADSGVNGLVEYSTVPGDGGNSDGYGVFSVPLPHQGVVTLNKSLDFERTQRYELLLVAADRALNSSERFSSTATLTIEVIDSDDQDPAFVYEGCTLSHSACVNPEYSVTVSSGDSMVLGPLDVYPEPIRAVDLDSIRSPIRYSFLSGHPSNYGQFFSIDPRTGVATQKEKVERNVATSFDIIVKAEEQSEQRRFSTAKLVITLRPADTHQPVVVASALAGYVDENSPVGTPVVDENGQRLTLTVTDEDLAPDDPKPGYLFELTSTAFRVNRQGQLVVQQDGLDRDQPNMDQFIFQVVAREIGGGAASAPVTLTVQLNDVNDNAPQLHPVKPITVEATDNRKQIVKIRADDADLGDNADVTYSIHHVSNNGREKFLIDPYTGIIETNGKLVAGERYSITVQAADSGGLTSQSIVEVEVVRGPNMKPPVFKQAIYDVQVSEGAAIDSTAATVHAVDPEGEPVHYSIMSGNELIQFGIGDTDGVISIIRKLDREELSRYALVIRAEDEGGLESTATVNIRVTDINDKNPEFVNLPYEFKLEETSQIGRFVGRVQAVDADADQNGRVTYSLPEDSPLQVDRNTGDIKTRTVIDYETQKEIKVVVTAKDGATDPRIATATVTVTVMDVEDEAPLFRRNYYEANVPENVPDYVVVQVEANDPDSRSQVTYVLRQGPSDKFSVDPQTGVVRTSQALDFEEESRYTLVIGTKENERDDDRSSIATVVVNVEDKNDIAPIFTSVPRPIRMQDTHPVGATVTTVVATDDDGTAPGNKVRYEIIGRGKAGRYFQIDPDMGIIRVRDDLRKELDSEYQIIVRAYDLGEPQLATQESVIVRVDHSSVTTESTAVNGMGFAEPFYTVEIPENALTNTTVKTLTIINRPTTAGHIPIECNIISGNEMDLFEISVTPDRNCLLSLRLPKLDYETRPQYNVTVGLHTLSGLLSPQRNETTVNVRVLDINDNRPEFVVPQRFQRFARDPKRLRYFAAVAHDTQVGSTVAHFHATDKDSGPFGLLEFSLANSSSNFNIDRLTGQVTNERTFDSVERSGLPFRFVAKVRDNPAAQNPSESLMSEMDVVVNLIEDKHRMVLVVHDSPPHQLKAKKEQILDILQDQTKLVAGIEKITADKYTQKPMRQRVSRDTNVTIHSTGTNVWFYVIDPSTEKILERGSSVVIDRILDKNATTPIAYFLTGNLGVTIDDIRPPPSFEDVEEPTSEPPIVKLSGGSNGGDWEGFPAALVALGCIIFILGIVGVVYICMLWSRYKSYKEASTLPRMVVQVPKYEPVFIEPNLKEYETQVLQMSVQIDDNDSFNDLQLDFNAHKNHAFNLDNVSYITKDSLGKDSPVDSAISEAATTARVESRGDQPERNLLGMELDLDRDELSPVDNPLYDDRHHHWHDDDDNVMNVSATNDNVTFREKKDLYNKRRFQYFTPDVTDNSIVEATTEL